ncbi:MAG: exoribonuclease-2 [Cellvibrionaceae bacterium]|jgi:exoribonuclease-2
MLDRNVLTQLSTLKKEIRASRDVQQGTVRGSSGRYGFIDLDDGRDIFLAPEQMQRVLNGDRVEVVVTQKNKEQFEARLEKLLFSPQKQIAGKYCLNDKGHFVIVEQHQHTRWFFVPSKLRISAQDGQYVTARIQQHPFDSGRVQIKNIQVLGPEFNAETMRKFTLASFQLHDGFPPDAKEQSQHLQTKKLELIDNDYRQDLRNLDFVTIDSKGTKDMDDALRIISTDEGWCLSVAIADPSDEILPDSPLDKVAWRRAQTIYFPGKPVTMLPEALSHERYSLVSGLDCYAIVCEMHIGTDGQVKRHRFIPAVIQSKGKLSYQQVTALLNGRDYTLPAQLDSAVPFRQQLQILKACTEAMRTYRRENQLVNEGRNDFLLILNERGHLEKIEKLKATIAHLLVEEAMVATNQCAGNFLAENKTGIAVVHRGYRNERREDIEKLLKEWLGQETFSDSRELDNFIAMNHTMQKDPEAKNALAVQRRFLQGSELSLEHEPHFGLGAPYYANITSPIRRYQDLVNLRSIHWILKGKKDKLGQIKPKVVKGLNEVLSNNRFALRFMEQWLIANYMKDKVGRTFQGYIALLTSQGVGIRLLDTGIEGFIVARKESKAKPGEDFDKISFNNQRMELSWNGVPLYYDQLVSVTLGAIDTDKKKLVFQWAEGAPGQTEKTPGEKQA